MSRFLKDPGVPITLKPRGGRPAAAHVFDAESVDAVNAALVACRPLLVRGEPGTGKSQLARAVAHQLGRALVTQVMDARSEARDLCWTVDAVARLAKAQLLGATGRDKGNLDEVQQALHLRHFVTPGALWWAFDWQSAKEQAKQAKEAEVARPPKPKGWQPGDGCVLLLDEIDKADTAVPNGLLEALGDGEFPVPPGCVEGERVAVKGTWPLVIITTNEARSLPDPFLRRCLVLELALPREEKALVECLRQRGRAHFPLENHPAATDVVLEGAAQQLVRDRKEMHGRNLSAPGQAEYIDLLRVVLELAVEYRKEPLALLGQLGKYALRKHPAEPEL